MMLRGRDPSLGLQGDDVTELLGDLRALGYQLPETGVTAKRFGSAADAAVRGFNRANGLDPSGLVDVTTANVK